MSKASKRPTRGESRDAWVSRITDPAQRALAEAVPELCAIFGVPVASFVGRRNTPDPRAMAANNFRIFAFGAVVHLGRHLGMHWEDMHGREQSNGRVGCTQVRELSAALRQSLVNARSRFAAFIGHATEDGIRVEAGEPVGYLGAYARECFERVARDAHRRFLELGGQPHVEDVA